MPKPNPSASPPPAAPATAATTRRRRHRLLPSSSSASSSAVPTTSASSSSSSASSSASSGLSFSLAPSPFHHRFFLSPLRASAVPFSWEHRPGIPKTPARQQTARGGSGKTAKAAAAAALPLPLPLPPSLLSSKVDGYFIVPDDDAKAPRRRRRRQRPPALAATLTDWLAVLSLYRSCTRSRDCLAGTPPPRPRAPAKFR
ncbi:uncharacterized protein [Miscanthus floridulus]|uniref:uncharacterized protein n=1 Tax=Miscanthus floridulus TaxID=154761 RepID=UPI0034579123